METVKYDAKLKFLAHAQKLKTTGQMQQIYRDHRIFWHSREQEPNQAIISKGESSIRSYIK